MNVDLYCPSCDHLQRTKLPDEIRWSRPEGDFNGHSECARVNVSYVSIANRVKDSGIREVAISFSENIRRLVSLANAAPLASGLSFGRVAGILIAASLMGYKTIEEYRDAIKRAYLEAIKLYAESPPEDAKKLAILRGHSEIRKWAENYTDVALGIEATMFAQITGAWTAFEALPEDLWVSYLNANPNAGLRVLSAEPSPDDSEEVRNQKRKVRCELPVHLLARYDYNLKNRMGTLLRKKWDFARRDRAIDAYQRASGKKNASLDAIFGNKNLGWLAALRNAIIHNAGVADDEFVTLMRGHSFFGQLAEGDRIQVDGKLVSEFVNTVVEQGVNLIGFVNEKMS